MSLSGKRSSVFGKKTERPSVGSMALPLTSVNNPSNQAPFTPLHQQPGSALSPRGTNNSNIVLERKRSSTGQSIPQEKTSSTGGSLRSKKRESSRDGDKTPREGVVQHFSVPVLKDEPSEIRAVKVLLTYFLQGMHYRTPDVFEVISTAVIKMPEGPSGRSIAKEKEALDSMMKAQITLGALIEERKKYCAAVLIQSVVRMRIARKRYLVIKNGPISKYLIVLSHILKVEEEYFEKLTAIIKNYKEPLISKNILDVTTLTVLFSTVENIRSISARIIQHLLVLRATPAMWSTIPAVGSFFLVIAASISSSYTEYAKDYAFLTEKIDSLQASNPKFESFMLEVSRTAAKQNNPLLLQLLPLPLNHIQNVENYLVRIAEVTEEAAKDDIVCAMGILQQTSSFLSKKREDMFYETQMIRLSKKIVGDNQTLNNIFNGSRRLLKEGELLSDKATKRQVYLLSDYVLIARPNIEASSSKQSNAIKTYVMEKLISLDGCTFLETPTFDGGRRFRAQDNDAMAFEFKTQEGTHRLYAANPEEKRSWVKEIKGIVDQRNKTRVFGLPLEALLEREGRLESGVPLIVERLVNHIKASGMLEEGLMRVSGVHQEITSLRQQFDKGEGSSVNLNDFGLATVCSLLKLFFRELPEPILTFDLYDPLVALQEQEELPLDERLNTIQKYVRRLPSINQKLLYYVLQFLLAVATCSTINKMTPTNLSIVMTPGLIRSRNQTTKTALQAPLANALTELLIEFCEDIFAETDAGNVIATNKRHTSDKVKTLSIQYKRLSVNFKKFQLELERALQNH